MKGILIKESERRGGEKGDIMGGWWEQGQRG